MLAAFVVVWGIASLDVGKGKHSGPDAPLPATQSVPTEQLEPATAPGDQAKSDQPLRAGGPGPSGSTPAAKRAPAGSAAPRAAQGSVATIGKRVLSAVKRAAPGAAPADESAHEQQKPASGELGEGILSPDFVELERQYADEPRDGEWALAEEQRVRALLRNQPLEKSVVLVHCQQSVCRMVLESDSADAFKQLLEVPGLREETALAPQTPYSLQSGQLALYFRRPEDTAQAAPR